MMRLIFHGAAEEVGRSCIEVQGEDRRFLLDCGLKLEEHGSSYPVGFDGQYVDDIDAVFISHAHLDHTGALPWMDHKGMECPIFATKTTKDLARLILRDAFKIGKITHAHLGYDQGDIKNVMKCMSKVKVGNNGSYSDINYHFYDAGHIPGSASILTEIDGKRILYTGDIKNADTLLQKAADTDFPEIDVMICESTYGDREHAVRPREDQRFIKAIKEVLADGGTVMIPVFALGRSQEILLMLAKEKFNVPIYLDGMANAATDIILENPGSIKDSNALVKALNKVKRIKKDTDRKAAVSDQSIIVTTSGMLTGGPIMHYLRYLGNEPKNAVLITGYQVEGTNGRMLLEERKVFIDGWRKSIACRVEQFDFSAHAGLSDLKNLVRDAAPKKVFFVHGDKAAVNGLKEWADAMGIEAHAPELGEIYELR